MSKVYRFAVVVLLVVGIIWAFRLQTVSAAPSPNLILNPGNEDPLVGGNIPHWIEAVATTWTQRGANPPPHSGAYYFFPGAAANAELRQDVDVSAYASAIDAGWQSFAFTGFVRSFNQSPTDSSRVIVEYRDAANTAVLSSYDTGEIRNVATWQQVTDTRLAPTGARFVRVRLISKRYNGSNLDGYYDTLSLIALDVIYPDISVNDAGDTTDANPGDGFCDSDLGTPGNQCTLRGAIEEANARSGPDSISFNLPPTALTIHLTAGLPVVTEPAIIDASTQPGAVCPTPVVELDGSGIGPYENILTLSGGGSTVRGLVINRSLFDGIRITDAGGNTITCNYIGTDVSGAVSLPNIDAGIRIIDSSDNQIGGTLPTDRNLISGNNIDGIRIDGPGSTGNRILGNWLGTDATGLLAVGNGYNGVALIDGASANTIGGTEPGAGNVISGNHKNGIGLRREDTTGNIIVGNTIGADVTGATALGNLQSGIVISGSVNTLVGGTSAESGNRISANGEHGVVIRGALATGNQLLGNDIGLGLYGFQDLGNGLNGVFITGGASYNIIGGMAGGADNTIGFNTRGVVIDSGIGNAVRGNDIYAHSQIGLDLVDPDHPDVTPNDPGDADDGPNHFQNFPVLTSVTGNLGSLTTVITGTLNSQANTLYDLDFFVNPDCSPTGHGEGEAFLGSAAVATNGSGNAAFTLTLPTPTLAGEYITATATDPDGNTSEFSACALVNDPQVYLVTNIADSGSGSLRQAILDANGHGGLDLIHFNIPGPGVHTIRPIIGLYALTGPVKIDGYSQPGASPNTLTVGNNALLTIELDGSLAGLADGLQIVGGNSSVRGLVVNRFEAAGISVRSGGNRIAGNFIGTDISGVTAQGNLGSGIDVTVGGNTIGGVNPADRNLISGNGNATDYANGIHLDNGAPDNIIQGNYIGTDRYGLFALGNRSEGIFVLSRSNLIGGTALGAGNLVSGNLGGGIDLFALGEAHENVVQGNFIGVNAAGTAPIANGVSGLDVGGNDNLIGGTTSAARNLIAGNAPALGMGIYGSRNVVQGNYIGTDTSGALALGNGRAINIADLVNAGPAEDNIIGGSEPGAGNLISGNTGDGIYLSGSRLHRTVIQGNMIGLNAAGTAALGNAGSGIFLWTSGAGTAQTIGGLGPGEGNNIAYNTAGGVTTESSVMQLTISGNTIFANGGLGIDLGDRPGGDGVTPNDPGDVDSGANGLQNFPLLQSVQFAANATTISGALNSAADATYRLEFFANPSCNPSGFGEGQTFLGTANVTTDGSGNASFTVTFPVAVPPDHVLSATATDALGNTSEFARCAPQVHQPTTYSVTNTADSGTGSLRQAIQNANANNALDTIVFNIPGPGPHTLTPLSPLPYLIDPVVLDAATQPGAACPTPVIELDGSQAGGFNAFEDPVTGLVVAGGNSTIRGLIINRFSGQGLRLQANGGNVVKCNYIGVDRTGTLGLGNLGLDIVTGGIHIADTPNNRIGGADAASRNLISGNGAQPHPVSGIYVEGTHATGNVMAGNYIGVDVSGTAVIPNTGWGVRLNYGANANLVGGTTGTGFNGPCAGACNLLSGNPNGGVSIDHAANGNQVRGNFIGTDRTGLLALPNGWGITVSDSSNNTIGGTTASAGNLVSGNTYYGVTIGTLSLVYSAETTRDNVVQGNRIGTNRTGVGALGNGRDGVYIDRVSHNKIGGATSGAANLIAFNGWSGVAIVYRAGPVEGGVGNTVLTNAVFGNTNLGLDLSGDGVTANDAGDADAGANNLQNYPVLSQATANSDGTTTVEGQLNSVPGTTVTLHFYTNTACDAGNYGEGEIYLGSAQVKTKGNGDAAIWVRLTAGTSGGQFVTATATDAAGNTSEFSACVPVLTNVLVSPGFESGPGVGWTESPAGIISTAQRHTGVYSAEECGVDNCTEYVEQLVTIPANGRLSYWYYLVSQDSTTTAADYLRVQLYNTSGKLVATLRTLSNTSPRNTWRQDTLNLAQGAGQTLWLRFTTTTNSSLPTVFYLDDISLR